MCNSCVLNKMNESVLEEGSLNSGIIIGTEMCFSKHHEEYIRIMKCSRSTLFDRKEALSKDIQKHSCHFQRAYQPELHNYQSWLNKQYSKYDEQPYLTVCNIALPRNITVFIDRGAKSEKWIQKRPRLQSAKTLPNSSPNQSRSNDDDNDTDGETKASDDERDSEIMEIQQVMEEYEIDENVQKLIHEAAEYDQKMQEEDVSDDEPDGIELEIMSESNDDEFDKRKKYTRKSAKPTKENKSKTKLSRTVTISLSRPPSPETIQVIRVDVTSNYSIDELDIDRDSGTEETVISQDECEGMIQEMRMSSVARRSHRLRHRQKSLIKSGKYPVTPELTLRCQKLALSDRKSSTAQMQ